MNISSCTLHVLFSVCEKPDAPTTTFWFKWTFCIELNIAKCDFWCKVILVKESHFCRLNIFLSLTLMSYWMSHKSLMQHQVWYSEFNVPLFIEIIMLIVTFLHCYLSKRNNSCCIILTLSSYILAIWISAAAPLCMFCFQFVSSSYYMQKPDAPKMTFWIQLMFVYWNNNAKCDFLCIFNLSGRISYYQIG